MKDDFFDQMMQVLSEESPRRAADVDPEVFRELMRDAEPPRREPPPVREAAPVRPVRPDLPPRREAAPAPAPAPVLPDVSGMDWDALAAAVRGCRGCHLCETRRNTVFGEGNLQAELMFVGEGPGADEDATGRPFVGRAGQLLDKMIAAMTFAREEVYIANVVKCRPPGNRNPSPEEAFACIGYLKRQIALVRPKVIVCLGGVALSFLCGESVGITRARGHWIDFAGIPVMPTFHPAYLLRQESAKRAAWSDLQQVMRALGRVRKRN